jgi:CRISPR-associated endonuclease Cas3-HD
MRRQFEEDFWAHGNSAHPTSYAIARQSMDLGRQYFAHSGNTTGHRHTLREHLGCVAALAADFAQNAPWQSEARLTGLLHDLGKYGDLFQRRLDGLENGLDHWSAGAFVAGASFGTLAAAVAIEGHHIGLQAASPDSFRARQRDLKSRHPLGLRLSESDFTLLRQRAELDGLKFEAPTRRIVDAGMLHPARNVAPMLDIRMLFSCLTDADFLDTEAHFLESAKFSMRFSPPPC